MNKYPSSILFWSIIHGFLMCSPVCIAGIAVTLIGCFGSINMYRIAGLAVIAVCIAVGILYPLCRLFKISKSMSGVEFDSLISDVLRIKKKIFYFPALVMTAEIITNPCDIVDEDEENLYEEEY